MKSKQANPSKPPNNNTEGSQSIPQDSATQSYQDSQSLQDQDSTQSTPHQSSKHQDKQQRSLTGKQRHFARCLAQGMTKTEAYLEAYQAENMARKTVNEAACRLSQDERVLARVQQLIVLKDKALIRSTGAIKTKVLNKLVEMMDSATPQDSAKLRAAELLGKSVGLFKEVIEDNRHQDKSPEELTAILEAKLLALSQDQTTH